MVRSKIRNDKDGVGTATAQEVEKASQTRKSVEKVQKLLPEEKKCFSFSIISKFCQQHYKTLINSKVPYYMCIITYIFICLLGNVVTAIILIKHRQIFSDTKNVTSILPFRINQSQSIENEIDLEEGINEEILQGLLDLVYNESEHEVSTNSSHGSISCK